MTESIIENIDPEDADVVVISANYDRTSSFGKGADKGPEAIMDAFNRQIEIFERLTKTEPSKNLGIAYMEIPELNEMTLEQMIKKVSEEFSRHYKKGKFIITLGGEHSISAGTCKALSEEKDITVVQIDAHFDLRNDDSDFNENPHGKYAHCSVMRRIHELGFNIVQIGIRTYHKDELEFAKNNENKIRFFEWKRQVPKIANILKAIETKNVYLTIDIDGIDPSHMPATGTPVQGGLEWYYFMDLIKDLFKKKNVIAADIVEVAPRPHDKLTEYGAAQIFYNMIAFKFENHLKK